MAYLSSRTYGGYATAPLNPEPIAYEGAFAARWVIQSQAAGDPLLNFDPAEGTVLAGRTAWADPWTDGVKGRKCDNLVWLKEDVSAGTMTPATRVARRSLTCCSNFFTRAAGQHLVSERWPFRFELTGFPDVNRSSIDEMHRPDAYRGARAVHPLLSPPRTLSSSSEPPSSPT